MVEPWRGFSMFDYEISDLDILQNDGETVWAGYTVWDASISSFRYVLVVWDDRTGSFIDAQAEVRSDATAWVESDRGVQRELSDLAAFQRARLKELH